MIPIRCNGVIYLTAPINKLKWGGVGRHPTQRFQEQRGQWAAEVLPGRWPFKSVCEKIKSMFDNQSGGSSSLKERFFMEKKIWRQARDCALDDK